MTTRSMLKYLLNGFLLMVPALLLNILWARRLPPMWQFDVFWKDIPPLIASGENITRIFVNLLPVLMPLSLSSGRQRAGLVVYVLGLSAYFAAWVMMVYFPQSAWSMSLVGSTATAWTSALWLMGVALLSESLFFRIPYRWWVYALLSIAFAAFHTAHAVIVYLRMP